MQIIIGSFYHCIDPSAPVFDCKVQITQLGSDPEDCRNNKVFFRCDSKAVFTGWAFSCTREDFERNFVPLDNSLLSPSVQASNYRAERVRGDTP